MHSAACLSDATDSDTTRAGTIHNVIVALRTNPINLESRHLLPDCEVHGCMMLGSAKLPVEASPISHLAPR
jgi:hypothetical protein